MLTGKLSSKSVSNYCAMQKCQWTDKLHLFIKHWCHSTLIKLLDIFPIFIISNALRCRSIVLIPVLIILCSFTCTISSDFRNSVDFLLSTFFDFSIDWFVHSEHLKVITSIHMDVIMSMIFYATIEPLVTTLFLLVWTCH